MLRSVQQAWEEAGVTGSPGEGAELSAGRLQRWGLQQGSPGFLCFFSPQACWDLCAQKGDRGKRLLIRYALCKQHPEAGQYERILCIIHAIVFVIREMPSGG